MKNKLLEKLKNHRQFFHHYLLAMVITPVLVLLVYSLLPPKVNGMKENTTYPVDGSLSLTVWGILNRSSVSVTTNPDIPVRLVWKESLIPLKNQLELQTDGLFNPNTLYEVTLEAKNIYGQKTKRKLIFNTSSLPKVASDNFSARKSQLPPSTVLTFNLEKSVSKGEIVFSSYPNFDFDQEVQDNKILISPKKLKQGQEYQISLYLKSQSRFLGPLYESNITTTSPLVLTSVSPSNEAHTVLKNSTLEFTFNKPLDKPSFEQDLLIDPLTEGKFNWKNSQSVEFIPSLPLKTSSSYKLILGEKLKAEDGSELEEKFTGGFATAGAVKVTSFLPSGGFPYVTTPIEVNFDQPVDQTSAQEKFSISPSVEGTFSWQGNKLIFKPKALVSTTDYSVTISPGIKTVGGEDSRETFTTNFRTTSELNKVIGYSVQKRPISATYLGTGPKKILLVGALHGSESNTGNMLSQWVSYLRNNQKQIPSEKSFIIVPYANPDGRAVGKRFNTNNVDLNRNWGTPDWQSLTFWQNRSYPNGGGSAPFSEPETLALRNLISNERPTAIITYHSAANMVIGGGIANSFGNWYANLTGYTRVQDEGEHEGCESALGYCITGTLEEWSTLQGIPTLVIEFISATSSEYERNLPALKGLLNYSF